MKLGAVFEDGLVAQQESFSPTSLGLSLITTPSGRGFKSTETSY